MGWTREQGLDRSLLAASGFLMLVGMLTLFSAGQTDVPTAVGDIWKRQLVWLLIGALGAVLIFRVSPRVVEWVTPFLYVLAMSLLVLTLFFGIGAGAAGAKSWLSVVGVRLGQPAELAKLTTILMLARHLVGRRDPPQTIWELAPSCVIVGIPVLLVALQPDLGSAIVFFGILFGMLFWAGVRPRLLLLLASPMISLLLAFSTAYWGAWIVVLTLILIWYRPYLLDGVVVWLTNVLMGVMALKLWSGLAPYQQSRLMSFLNPEIDPRATGWHIIQSKVAIGSGGLLGKGFLDGTQKRLAFLPAQHTDFIFSVMGEEFGFIGVVVMLALLGLFVMALVKIARRATDPFSCVVVFGLAALFLTHSVENVGMTVGLLPITGIPLPFFSYGGSFLVTCCLAVGLALRVAWDSRLAGYAAL